MACSHLTQQNYAYAMQCGLQGVETAEITKLTAIEAPIVGGQVRETAGLHDRKGSEPVVLLHGSEDNRIDLRQPSQVGIKGKQGAYMQILFEYELRFRRGQGCDKMEPVRQEDDRENPLRTVISHRLMISLYGHSMDCGRI